jgi:hypothetical protein
MEDVGFGKGDGDIAVGMGRAVIFERDRRTVELQLALVGDDFARNCTARRGQEIIIPVLDALDFRQMSFRVLMGDDPGAGRVQPFVAVGVIEMPVGVDQVRDRLAAERLQRLGELRTRHTDAAVDQDLAVGARQHGDVAARSFEHADIVAQPVGHDRRRCGAVLDQAHEAARFGKRLSRRQPSRCGGKGAAGAA